MILARGRERSNVVVLVLLLFLSSIRCSRGLYEEQDGKYNWYEQHVGIYREMVPCPESNLDYGLRGGFLVATNEGVVARLSEEDGSIIWRLVLEDGDSILPGTLSCATQYAVFASLNSKSNTVVAHVLRASAGNQIWEEVVYQGREHQGEVSLLLTTNGVLIGGPEVLRYKRSSDGYTLWSNDDIVQGPRGVYLKSKNDDILIFSKHVSGKSILIARLRESDGSVIGQKNVQYSNNGRYLRVLDSALVEVSSDETHVCFIMLESGIQCLAATSGTDDKIRYGHVTDDFVVLSTHKKTLSIRIDAKSNAPSIDATFDGVVGMVSNIYSDMIAISSLSLDVDKQGIYVASILNGIIQKPILKKYPDIPPSYVGGGYIVPSAIAVGNTGLIVQFAEGTTLSMTKDISDVKWKRHESLAYISESMFSELPPSNAHNEHEWQKRQPSLSKKLFVQLLILKSQLGMKGSNDLELIDKHKTLTRDILRPTRDIDGFRKQIIVVTQAGKVASLHSGNGGILWEVNFPKEYSEIHVQHWFTSETRNVLSIFAKSLDKMSVFLVDGFTGKILEEHISVPYFKDINVLALDPVRTNDGEQSIYVILDQSNMVLKILPFDDQAALVNFERQSDYLVRWGISNDGKSIYGAKLNHPGMAPNLRWKVDIVPQDSDMQILDVSSRDKSEAIYSAAKPIYGGGILMKNINPNILLVVAGGNDKLIVTALDTISGRVLYTREIPGGVGPVKSILSEHWAAYNFWHQEHGRWYIGVIDTYYPQPADLDVINLMFSHASKNGTVSPYDAPPNLIVQAEAFRTKFSASCLAVTKTAHGTTSKMLLLGTSNGQIISIDRRMLDPRRPKILPGTKPSPEQAYERLPPYHPELGVSGPSFITLYHRVERLQSIQTHPATLESSSLVFSYGLDTYFMRMQPSRGFDMVPDDFPHALLVLVVVGLSVSLSVLRKIIQRRTLRMTWK